MTQSILLILSLSLITLFSKSVMARSESLMVVTEHLPPFQIIDNDPKHPVEGYGIEILKETLKHAHMDYTIMPMNWDRAYRLGQIKPNTLIMSMVRKPEREKMFHWLIKLSDSKSSLWSYKGNQKTLNSLAEITTEIIALNRNDHHQLMLQEYPNLTEKNFIYTSSKEQAFALVSKHRADYFLANDFILNWRLKLAKLNKDDFVELFEFSQQKNELYIAASLETSPRIRRKISRAYAELRANGKIKTLADIWFKPTLLQSN